MTAANVLAAVVTYNPDAELAGNLAALRAEVGSVLVVDNGSANAAEVQAAALQAGCRFLPNVSNIGIAAALSQAAEVAEREDFEWLATFDQDSRVQAGSIGSLLELHRRHPTRERIAALAHSHRDRAGGRDYHLPFDVLEDGGEWRTVRSTITSGSLIATDVFSRVGRFDDKLFIDAVDHDFYLRCRRHGYLIVEGKDQLLEHSLGNVVTRRVLGLKVMFTNHSPRRRYFMTRNALEVYRRYLTYDPLWSLRGYAHLMAATTLALLYERQRGAKLKAVLEGARDFALRRFGPYRDSAG